VTALLGAVLAAVTIWLAAWWMERNRRLDRGLLRFLRSLGPEASEESKAAAVELYRVTVAGVGPVQILVQWIVWLRAVRMLCTDAAGAAWERRERFQEFLNQARREA
jgi:hypothetical protein